MDQCHFERVLYTELLNTVLIRMPYELIFNNAYMVPVSTVHNHYHFHFPSKNTFHNDILRILPGVIELIGSRLYLLQVPVSVHLCLVNSDLHSLSFTSLALGSISLTFYDLIFQCCQSHPLMLINYDPIRSQFCTCHDSFAVMTCAKLWPDQMIIFHTKATLII